MKYCRIGFLRRRSRPLGLQRLDWRLLFVLATVGIFNFAVPTGSAWAQSGSPIQFGFPPVLWVTSGTETPVSIQVQPREILADNDFVLIRGLPRSVTLSAGRMFDSGTWGVKVSELDNLSIAADEEALGRNELVVSLTTLDGRLLAKSQSSLVVVPEESTEAISEGDISDPSDDNTVVSSNFESPLPQDRTGPALTASTGSTQLTDAEIQEAQFLTQKGDENLQQGKINIARLFYTRAADKGWADAALALARTYDESELRTMNAVGIEPDAEIARKWYSRAAELGSDDARTKLSAFPGGGSQ